MSGKLLPTYCNKCGYSTGFGGGDVCQNCKDNQSIAERVCEVLARERPGGGPGEIQMGSQSR